MFADMPSSCKFSIPETILTYANASVDAVISVQLVKNTELDSELDGIESSFGMCWGEIRKWINHPMNYINLQPDVVELLRRKDVLITPTPSLMAQIKDLIQYNARHPQAEEHFLKRFPQGTYEYTIVPTTHTDPLFSRHEDTSQSVEHPAPYYETLVFKSDAHPCFVLSFAMLDIIRMRRQISLVSSDLFPVRGCAIYASWHQPLPFYCRPYLGWIPRKIPQRYVNHLRPQKPSPRERLPQIAHSGNSTLSGDALPHRKRQRLLSALPPAEDERMNSVDNWRCGIVHSEIVCTVGDDALDAYQRETSRRLPDVMGNDSLFRRTVTSSRNFALLSKRKRSCATGQ